MSDLPAFDPDPLVAGSTPASPSGGGPAPGGDADTRPLVPVADADRPRRSRRATRLLVVAPDAEGAPRVLLFHDSDPGVPGSSWWFTPGGGVEDGEDWVVAGVRELREETGVSVPPEALRGPVLHRIVVHGFSDAVTDQEEMFFRVELAGVVDLDTSGHTELERQTLRGHAWLRADELPRLAEPVWPVILPSLLHADAPGGPHVPIEGGIVEESTVPASRGWRESGSGASRAARVAREETA